MAHAPKGKNARRLELEEGVAFQDPVKSPKMTVTGDDGRGGNTVLENESRVFQRQDWQSDKVHESVEVILARASDIISHYREKQPVLLEEERKVANGALGRPVDGDVLVGAKPLATELRQKVPEFDELAKAGSIYANAYNAFAEECEKGGQKIDELADQLGEQVAKLAHILKIQDQPGGLLLERC